jgi:hypothetical protein
MEMFEKRLRAFTYAIGITFLILVALTVITYIWFLLLLNGAFDRIPAFAGMPELEIAEYLLDLKILVIIAGAIYLTCGLWLRKLKKEAN